MRVDVCVYGGTSAGVIAAVAVAQQGKTVLLIEPGRHLGGLTSGGLGYTDFGNMAVIGGMSRDFYRRLGKVYGQDEAWHFEPHVAEKDFDELVNHKNITLLREHRLAGVEIGNARITRITLEHVPVDQVNAPVASTPGAATIPVEATMFIDASYEGDLMARAKVSYTVGRESVAQYGESLNGIRAQTPYHQFLVRTDPYRVPGDPKSGLLPLIQTGDGGKAGDGDRCVQAYNFRLCLTQVADNRLPIQPPPGYDPARYEILARHVQALVVAGKPVTIKGMLKIDPMPNGKTDINNNGAVSTDYIGQNYAYPDGDYATRGRIWHEHLDYIKGLLHFIATDSRIPQTLRAEMQTWGPCKDEFVDTGGWPHQMYVREARRMIGRYVVTQADCEHRTTIEDAVAMAAYTMDSHNCQRVVRDGAAENEGDVQVHPTGPYPIGYSAITPKREECQNLLVPVCLSASHIAYGSIRMEPVFMILGQSSALAACQAIDQKRAVQDIDWITYQKTLRQAGQILEASGVK